MYSATPLCLSNEEEARLFKKAWLLTEVGALPRQRAAVSPLAVEGVDLGLTPVEIVKFVHAGRKSWDED